MRESWVMVVCSPFVEMVGNIVPTGVGRGILKVNHNILFILYVSQGHCQILEDAHTAMFRRVGRKLNIEA